MVKVRALERSGILLRLNSRQKTATIRKSAQKNCRNEEAPASGRGHKRCQSALVNPAAANFSGGSGLSCLTCLGLKA